MATSRAKKSFKSGSRSRPGQLSAISACQVSREPVGVGSMVMVSDLWGHYHSRIIDDFELISAWANKNDE